MSQFEQLTMLYNQLIKISEEENFLVDKKAYDELEEKLHHKDLLIQQVVELKHMLKLSPKEAEEFSKLENTYKTNEENNIEKFSKIRDDLAAKLKNTNSNLKVKSAYAKVKNNEQGSILDFSE